MTLTKYEIFNKVAELNSFTKAAEVLGFTQSAVSHAISSLEKEFSFPLFIRNHSTLTLTKNAEELLITVRKILYYNNMLKQEVAAINGFQKGTVRVGVFSSISKNWIPGILKNGGKVSKYWNWITGRKLCWGWELVTKREIRLWIY